MKKALLLLICSILLSWSLFATQLNVLAELFSSTGCPYCPSAQLGLQQLYDQNPNVIPITWYTSFLGSTVISPNANARIGWYGQGSIPYARFAGTGSALGGATTGSTYTTYLQKYNQVVNRVSPLEITPTLDLDGSGNLVVTANINVTAAFTETNNKVCVVITKHPPSPPYRFLALGYNEQAFTLTELGQSQTYTASIPMGANWDLSQIKAVVFVQTWAGDKRVLQAAQTGFSGLMPLFTADITSGPKDLTVNFTDMSLPTGGIMVWEWDFNNDNIVDSYEQNPSYTFTQEGTYSVKLKISDGTNDLTTTRTDFITVTGVQNVSGNVQGLWKPEYGTYMITGDVTIPENNNLVIMPGTQLQFAENTGLTINGKLNTELSGDPIVFTSATNWKGIIVGNTADTVIFNNCRFSKAMSTAIKTTGSDIIVKSSRFINNVAVSLPATIDIANSDNSQILGCYFANNSSTNNTSGINISGSTVIIKNNVIVNNTGRNASAVMVRNNSNVNLINNTIANNQNLITPGGQVLIQSSTADIMNTIIKGTNVITSINGLISAQYSSITGGYEGVGNIDTDPLFVNPTTQEGYGTTASIAGWYLSAGSPCIDAGNPDELYNDQNVNGQPTVALFPSMGTIRNDIGAFGGAAVINWLPESEIVINKPVNLSLVTYPNPFNPNINIQFNRINNSNQKINVTIYNAKGQRVSNLFDSYSSNKNLQFTWNGKNSNNNTMPSGIYFVKASCGAEVITKKIVLLK